MVLFGHQKAQEKAKGKAHENNCHAVVIFVVVLFALPRIQCEGFEHKKSRRKSDCGVTMA